MASAELGIPVCLNSSAVAGVTAPVTLAGNLAAVYSGTWTDGRSDDPTGDAENGGLSHNLTLTATFKPPKSLGDEFARENSTMALSASASSCFVGSRRSIQ